MNKYSLIKSAIIATSLTATAYANLWPGSYVGVNAGLAFNHHKLRAHHLGFTNPSERCNNTANFATLVPGTQGGYLTQYSPSYLVGLEADAAFYAHQKDTLGCRSAFNPAIYDRFTFRNRAQVALKGRVGYETRWNEMNLLPYLTAGLSLASIELKYRNEINDHYSNNSIRPGLVIGTGVEWAFNPNWSLRAEYSYTDYVSASVRIRNIYGLTDTHGIGRLALSSNKFILGFNYWM